MDDVIRWADATIEWADGDPTKGNLIVGSPLAIALALRAIARQWFGRPGWRDDLDEAFAAAEGTDPLTVGLVCSWRFGIGIGLGVFVADDAAMATTERALQFAQVSADDYAVEIARYVLAGVLFYRDAASDRARGVDLLRQVRKTLVRAPDARIRAAYRRHSHCT